MVGAATRAVVAYRRTRWRELNGACWVDVLRGVLFLHILQERGESAGQQQQHKQHHTDKRNAVKV